MNEADALDIVQSAIWTVILASSPAVGAAMVVGVAIALLQALTQIQEITLTFIPKIVVILIVVALTGPLIGAEILEPLRLGRVVSPIVRGHHERWDGTGYPDRLRGDAIPRGARVVAIVDAHDAMTHDRPYRARLSNEAALAELRRSRGTQFDPELVDLFIAKLDDITALSAKEADRYTRGLRDGHEGHTR